MPRNLIAQSYISMPVRVSHTSTTSLLNVVCIVDEVTSKVASGDKTAVDRIAEKNGRKNSSRVQVEGCLYTPSEPWHGTLKV
jgi:hypothetical protein